MHEIFFGHGIDLAEEDDEQSTNRLKHQLGDLNAADLFTKPLTREVFRKHCDAVGMIP